VNTHWTERLSDYVDGHLSPGEAIACDAHLARCAECRAVVADLRMVIGIAKADPDQMPATDLWPAVLSRIAPADAGARTLSGGFPSETAGAAAVNHRDRTSTRRQIVFTLPQLALAASLLIAVSASVAYLAAGRAAAPLTSPEHPVQAQAEPLLPPSPEVQPANFADAEYDRAVADLESILIDMRDELDPRTVVVIERNLSAIDQAIREARAALDADPANTFLNSHLVDARRKKLELLRRATMIQSTTGD
jgi:hypothetical protein